MNLKVTWETSAQIVWAVLYFMKYEEIIQFCQSLPVTTHVVQWGGSDVWKVGGKVFAIGGWNKGGEPGITFKVSEIV